MAIIHHKTHQKDHSDISHGNNQAKRVAKAPRQVTYTPNTTLPCLKCILQKALDQGFTTAQEAQLQSPEIKLLLPGSSQQKALNSSY